MGTPLTTNEVYMMTAAVAALGYLYGPRYLPLDSTYSAVAGAAVGYVVGPKVYDKLTNVDSKTPSPVDP